MSRSAEPIHILHVDDAVEFTDTVADHLEEEDQRFVVETVRGADAGLERLSADDVDCIVADYELPDRTGLEFLDAVRRDYGDIPFILFTGQGSEDVASEAISAGVTDYLQKETRGGEFTRLADRIDHAIAARRSSREAERKRHRFEQILKTVPACVVQINYEGQFVFANERAEEVLGLDPDTVSERTYNDPSWDITDLKGNPIPDEKLPFRQVRDTGEPLFGFQHTIEWPDGTRKVLLVNGAPLFDSEGNVESSVFALTDITEARRRERMLERQNERLDEFASVVSHDLRGPLNMAMLQLDWARQDCDSERLDALERSHERIRALIDDVLDLARQGEVVSEPGEVDLGALFEASGRQIDTSGAILVNDADSRVLADGNRLRRLLENLIRNAVEHGGEEVTVTLGDIPGGFYVEDDGVGIPAGERETVFETGYSQTETGTGFGLSIVREIAQAHGWSIRATEGTEGGARFEITGVEKV